MRERRNSTVNKMTYVVAIALILIMTAVISAGCRTRIELADFTEPELIENYEGDWHFYKKRGVKPTDYVMATVITDAVMTADELGRTGDYYIVEEDGRVDIMAPELFKEKYVRAK